MVSHIRFIWSGFLTVICITALGCGSAAPSSPPPPATAHAAGALTAADRTHVARAAAYAAEVARYQQIAANERAMATTYAEWVPDATRRVTTNYNAKLKAEAEVVAAASDRAAAEVQKYAAFHTAAATAELSR